MIFAALRALWGFAKLIPWWVYLALVLVVYHVVAIHIAEGRGRDEADAKWQKEIAQEKAAYDAEVVKLKAKQQEVITRTVIEYRDRVKIVKEKGDEIVREIPVLVMDSPVLSGGVRVLHDAAAAGQLPRDPEGAARAADPVATATLMEAVAVNYTACNANAEKLVALQKLVSSLESKP